MRLARGLTVIEVLIALAVIAVAFAALAYAQLTSLKASSRSRITSEAKTVAENVLEDQLKQVLHVDTTISATSPYNDGTSTSPKEFYFVDYYWGCSSSVSIKNPSGNRSAVNSSVVQCTDTVQRNVQDGTIDATWTIAGESGPLGEGVIDITVTGNHSAGASVTVSDRVSCYDVYPSPTIDTPAPCPVATQSGGGRD